MDNNANQNINKADLIAALKVNIKAAADIISMPAEEKREIYKLYGVVIKALGKLSSDPNKVTSPEQLETIENQNKIQANPELFGILSNPVFYTCMFSGDMKDYFSDPSKINLPVVNKKDNPYYQFFKTLDSFKKRMNRLSSLGVVPNYSFDVADLRMLYGVYKDQQVEKIDITKGEPEKEEVAFDDEEILKEIEEDSKKQQEEAEKEAEKQLTEEDIEDQSFEEYEKSLQKFKTQINNQVKAITDVLTTLYASGFSAIAQTGILCQLDDSPVAQLKEINGHYGMFTLVDENLSNDQLILEILKEKVPEFDVYPNIDGKDAVPPTSFLLNNNGICNILHLQFQKASIRAVTGLISIRRFITATQLEKSGCKDVDEWVKKCNAGKEELLKFDIVKQWYSWAVNRIFVRVLKDVGFNPEKSFNKEGITQLGEILGAVSKNLRNIIVIAERDEDKEEFRVSTEKALYDYEHNNFAEFKTLIENGLNIGASDTIEVKNIKQKDHVVSFTVIYNKENENKANLFAAGIVDKLIESGNSPSWSHALLGKNLDDGTYFFWDDFMDPDKAMPAKRCYTIYAASRSGKGVMTSTLVASALCDKRQVFYTDAKPENGAALGELAWRDHKEAYVFNGTAVGSSPYSGYMETYAGDVRTPKEVSDYIDKLPKSLFENGKYFDNAGQAKFLGLMRYLKSLSLCASIIEARASGQLQKDNWQVWIFDEVTHISSIEKDIRKIFYKYLIAAGVTPTGVGEKGEDPYFVGFKKPAELEKATKKGSSDYNEGVDYIAKWNDWTQRILAVTMKAAVISLGKADMNLIFIFQEPSWIATDKGITCICKIIKALKSTKIAGNGAIPREAGQAAGEYGDATIKKDWIDQINKPGAGHWAISHSSNIKQSEVTLFRPYNVYTKYLGTGKQLEPECYLAGYVDKLLGAFNVKASDILQDAYNYAENAVQTMQYANTLKEFMYDCTNFAVTVSDDSFDNLKKTLENDNDDEFTTGKESDSSHQATGYVIGSGESSSENGNTNSMSPETSQEMQNINNQNKMMYNLSMFPYKSASQIIRDQDTSAKVQTRIQNEFVHPQKRFDLFDRTQNKFGLNHLCWNISIWVAYFQHDIPGDTEASVSLFCARYAQLLSTGKIAPDYIPDEKMVQALASNSQQSNQVIQQAVNTGELQNPVNYQESVNRAEQIQQDSHANMMQNSTVPQFSEKNGSVVINKQNGNEQIIELTSANSIDFIKPIDSKHLKLMSRSQSGRSRIFENVMIEIIKAIDKKIPDRSAVIRILARDRNLTVNGMIVNVNALIENNPYGMRFEDVVIIRELMETYKSVKELTIDCIMFDQISIDYGDTAQDIWKLFKQCPSLQTLRVQFAPGEAEKVITRNSFADKAAELQSAAKKRNLKLQLDAAAAMKNPRLASQDIGEVSLAYRMASSWGNAFVDKMTADNPQVFRGTLFGIGSLVLFTISKAGSAGRRIGSFFNRDK